MISFADQLIELVTLWKEFVETEERTDKAAFARWILEKDGRNDAIDQYDNDIQAYFSEAGAKIANLQPYVAVRNVSLPASKAL